LLYYTQPVTSRWVTPLSLVTTQGFFMSNREFFPGPIAYQVVIQGSGSVKYVGKISIF